MFEFDQQSNPVNREFEGPPFYRKLILQALPVNCTVALAWHGARSKASHKFTQKLWSIELADMQSLERLIVSRYRSISNLSTKRTRKNSSLWDARQLLHAHYVPKTRYCVLQKSSILGTKADMEWDLTQKVLITEASSKKPPPISGSLQTIVQKIRVVKVLLRWFRCPSFLSEPL